MKHYKLSLLVGFMLALTYSALPAQKWLEMWQDPNGHTFSEIQEEFNRYFETHDKGKGTGYKVFKRWEYFMEDRVGEDGNIWNPNLLTFKNYMKYVQERS